MPSNRLGGDITRKSSKHMTHTSRASRSSGTRPVNKMKPVSNTGSSTGASRETGSIGMGRPKNRM